MTDGLAHPTNYLCYNLPFLNRLFQAPEMMTPDVTSPSRGPKQNPRLKIQQTKA